MMRSREQRRDALVQEIIRLRYRIRPWGPRRPELRERLGRLQAELRAHDAEADR